MSGEAAPSHNPVTAGLYAISSPVIETVVRGSISLFYLGRHAVRAMSIENYFAMAHEDSAHACKYKNIAEVRAAWVQQLWRAFTGILPIIAPAYWMSQDSKVDKVEADDIQPGFWNHVVAVIQGPQLRELYKCEETISVALAALQPRQA